MSTEKFPISHRCTRKDKSLLRCHRFGQKNWARASAQRFVRAVGN
jgi:hypothetical protein